MKDKFCSPLQLKNGTFIYGGAARNKRIARGGGLENILNKVICSTYEELNAEPDNKKHVNNVIAFARKSA